jgi:hypothetical protein
MTGCYLYLEWFAQGVIIIIIIIIIIYLYFIHAHFVIGHWAVKLACK